MKNIKNQIIELGHELSEENNRAMDLWSWLPSYKVTEKYHGDYVFEFMPTVRDILYEANLYISSLKGYSDTDANTKEWFERCCCGEDHE
jgi:hypothetical protein